CVEERDLAAVDLDLIGADVLRDATSLTGRDARVANRVQERGLAMVHVAHHRDDRWTRLAANVVGVRARAAGGGLWAGGHAGGGRRGGGFLRLVADGRRDLRRRVVVDDLIDAGKNPLRDERADHLVDRDIQQFRQILDHDLRRNGDRSGRFRRGGYPRTA